MTAEATLNSIISNALSTAQTKAVESTSKADEAIQVLSSAAWFPQQAPVFSGGPTNPTRPSSTTSDPSSTISSGLTADAARLTGLLAGIFDGFLTQYFPRSSAVVAAAENWLETTIVNGATGIPVAVENQLWERSRSREITDGARLQDEATASFAARGFSLPPGALVGQLQEIQQSVANKVSTHSRDVAIKQAEIQIETIKFAVEQALNYRLRAIAAAIDYWKAYLMPEEIATRKANLLADLKLKFYDSAVALYNADVNLYGQQVRNNAEFMGMTLRGFEKEEEVKQTYAKSQADIAMSAATAAASQAAAALGSLNTMSQLANVTNISG